MLLSEVVTERVDWLWPHYLPLGKLAMLDGDPSVGKSTLATDIAARVTTGRPMPDGSGGGKPHGVVLLAAEDGLADTIKPRFEAAGADLQRVAALQGIEHSDEGGTFLATPTTDDVDAIRNEILRVDARLVIVDVLMAYLPGKVNSYRDQDVRRALAPLIALADETGATVLCLRHLNKGAGADALYRGGGSIGIIGAARAGFIAAFDPDDDTKERRVFAVSKLNGGKPGPAWSYRLIGAADHGCASIEWVGTTSHSLNALLEAPTPGEERSARAEAEDFILDALASGPIMAKRLQNEADQAGISTATLNRARSSLKRAGKIRGGPTGVGTSWEWTLTEPRDAHRNPEMLTSQT